MIAKLENNAYTLYSEANHVIGTVKINLEPNFTNNQILVDQNVYTIVTVGHLKFMRTTKSFII